MRSIKALVKELVGERPREYDAFSVLDSNVLELLGRIERLEKKNLQYYCKAERSTAQSFASGVPAAVIFNETSYPQLGNMHDNVADNDRILIRRDGVYSIHGFMKWAVAQSVQLGYINLYRGGSIVLAGHTAIGSVSYESRLTVSTSHYCYLGDIIQLVGLQIGFAPLNLVTSNLVVTERREDLNPEELGLLDPNALTF